MEPVSEPLGDGHRKPLLGLVDHLPWQISLHQLLEEVLGLSAPELEGNRQTGRKLDQPVVQKGHAQFHRSRHRHLVSLDQEVIGQPGLCIYVQHPVQRRRGFDSIVVAIERRRQECIRAEALQRAPLDQLSFVAVQKMSGDAAIACVERLPHRSEVRREPAPTTQGDEAPAERTRKREERRGL